MSVAPVDTVFLDRDGTINVKAAEGDYVTTPDRLELLPGAADAIRRLNAAGLKVIVVTNQRGVALGRMSEADLARVHERLLRELRARGARVDAFYACTHDTGCCTCRKPDTGLFLRAQRDLAGLDFARALVIGDGRADMDAAARLGCRRILIDAAAPDGDAGDQLVARSLAEAVERLLGPERLTIYGVHFDATTQEGAISRVRDDLEHERGGWIMPVNLDCLRQLCSHPELRRLAEEADLVLPDGMPIVWAGRLGGALVPERVAGADLVPVLAAEAAEAGASLFLLGGSPGTAEAAAEVLVGRHPKLEIAGVYSPPFGFEDDPEELARIEEELRRTRPHVVLVALGFPKQELLIERLRGAFPSTWFVSVGASLDFVSGRTARAPLWMQRTGLEWLHRLTHEPRRLFKRYILLDLPFALRLAGHVLVARSKSPRIRPA